MARVSISREMGISSRFGTRIITLRCGHTCRRNAGILKKEQTQSVVCTHSRLLITSQYRYYQLVIITNTSKQQISYSVLQFTLSRGLNPIKHATIVSY